MNETNINRAAADYAAIARWEDEGGRALTSEEPARARPGDFPRSDLEGGTKSGARSQASSARERPWTR